MHCLFRTVFRTPNCKRTRYNRGRYRLTLPFLLVCLLFFLFPTFATAASFSERPCTWYLGRGGETPELLARRFQLPVIDLMEANGLHERNGNLKGQVLCIPATEAGRTIAVAPEKQGPSGLQPDGSVRRFAYEALETSTLEQVSDLLLTEAATRHIPPALLRALAWQESGWQQQLIAEDGGIGVMQLMPETVDELNSREGKKRDPYKVRDNIQLGALYVHYLWERYHGDLRKVISAYNQGPGTLEKHGVRNNQYVHTVLALMKRFSA